MVPRSRVVVLDPHLMFGECLAVALESHGFEADHLRHAGSPATATQLRSAARSRRPDVVILNLDLGLVAHGSSLVEHLTRDGIDVVVLTEGGDRARCGEALSRGAKAVLFKDGPLEGVLAALERIRDQVPAMGSRERRDLIAAYHQEDEDRRSDRVRLDSLSVRECQILQQLMGGRSVVQIARTDVVAEATVRTQVKSILGKLDVSSQLEAVGLANRQQWRLRGH